MSKKIKKNSKLHLGCGKIYIPNFVHVDINDYKHIDYITDIKKLKMFKSNSFDLIYACHVIEYFDDKEIISVLKEWKRILNSKGIIRLSVPNFDSIIKIYKKYKDINYIGVKGPIFGRWKNNKTGKYFYHKNLYTYKSLNNILVKSGFKNIKKYDWKKTEHSKVDDYSQAYVPHMDQKGILLSLNVEAEK